MEYQDYYARLGVSRDADPETIKRAYRSMARRYHPDINRDDPDAERVLKAINEAYAVLSDPEKRRLYDRFGAAWQQAQRKGVGFDWAEWFNTGGGDEARRSRRTKRPEAEQTVEAARDASSDSSAFSDFFQALFGGGGERNTRRTRGNRRRVRQATEQILPVEITLEEAFWGTTRTIQLGDVRYQVTIPQGVDTGSKVHIPLRQGQSENLYLLVRVQEHEYFRRVKSDLHMRAPVDLYTMLLGGQVKIPTLQGPLALKIPPNTQNGRVFRLAGQGMPDMHQPQNRGDLYVEAVAELPVPLNDEERARYLALQRLRQRGRSR